MTDGPNDRNWGALLKWSLAQTDDGNTAGVVGESTDTDIAQLPLRQITEEDRKWFVQAMQNGMVDEIKRMKDITQALAVDSDAVLETQEDIDARLTLMEELNDRVCSVDNGGDLHTIGGLVPVVNTLRSPHASLRSAAAEVIGTTVQNHSKAQLAAVECECVKPLLAMVQGEGGDAPPKAVENTIVSDDKNVLVAALETCRVKALLGLSSLTRGCSLAVANLINKRGISALKHALESSSPMVKQSDANANTQLISLIKKAKTKAIHVARHLCVMSDGVMSNVVDAELLLSACDALTSAIPSFGFLAGDWSDKTRKSEKTNLSSESIQSGQLREAALRFLLDVAQCVDFEKCPKALDDLRSEKCVAAINTVGRWYATFDAEERETHQDEMTVCAELAKMFG